VGQGNVQRFKKRMKSDPSSEGRKNVLKSKKSIESVHKV